MLNTTSTTTITTPNAIPPVYQSIHLSLTSEGEHVGEIILDPVTRNLGVSNADEFLPLIESSDDPNFVLKTLDTWINGFQEAKRLYEHSLSESGSTTQQQAN